MMALGAACVLGGSGLLVHNIYENMVVEEKRGQILYDLAYAAEVGPGSTESDDIWNGLFDGEDDVPTELPVITIDGRDYVGILSIPSLELDLPVQKEWSYDNIKVSPSVYCGSVLTGDMVICAHNYQAHFGKLRGSAEGDLVVFKDMAGNEYRYQVAENTVVDPYAQEEVRSSGYPLSLLTCTPGGQQRVLIRCEEVDGQGRT